MHIETWSLYFPEDELTVHNDAVAVVAAAKERIAAILSASELEQIVETRTYSVSMQTLCELVGDDGLQGNAANALLCISCAVSELVYDRTGQSATVRTRMSTFQAQSRFTDIDASGLGRLVFVTGTVCRVGFKRAVSSKMFFECLKCGETVCTEVQNNTYKQPRRCREACRSKTFAFIHNHPDMMCRDVQEIKIQELCGYAADDSVSIPKTVDCLVYDEFVGALAPGDIVQAVGVLGAEPESAGLYKLAVQINNIQVVRNRNFFVESLEYQGEDYLEFRRIARTENIVAMLVQSLYPSIYGNELIRAGLVLALFGGTRKSAGQNVVRSEVHILIIGDPGLGKSRMLLSTCSILPKSSYVSGSFTTTAGLTVSLTHDPVSGEYMADAGALVVADNGICCLDEFDKIEDHAALFEAMEDQRVTVAKGGVICSVPTRSAIVAATNPKHGHFDRTKSVSENLRFDPALLSRFDLIFVLLDNLSEKESYEISGQILKRRQVVADSPLTELVDTLREDTLVQTLRSKECVYPMEILRKYIAYARASVFPALSRAAKDTVKEYYLGIRNRAGVTARDLESLVRLTEARAKMELRSIATRADAMFCIEVYKRVLISEEKICRTKRAPRDLAELLREHVKKECRDTISNDELCKLLAGFDASRPVNEFIDMLNHRGLIIKRGANVYKIVA